MQVLTQISVTFLLTLAMVPREGYAQNGGIGLGQGVEFEGEAGGKKWF